MKRFLYDIFIILAVILVFNTILFFLLKIIIIVAMKNIRTKNSIHLFYRILMESEWVNIRQNTVCLTFRQVVTHIVI